MEILHACYVTCDKLQCHTLVVFLLVLRCLASVLWMFSIIIKIHNIQPIHNRSMAYSLQVGSRRLFISSFPEAYPREVRVFSSITDPLPTRRCQAAPGGEDGRVCAAVMMAGTNASSNQDETAAARRARAAAEAEAGAGP